MNALIALLVTYLPKIGAATDLLVKIPDAIESAKELKEFVEKVMAILNRPGLLSVEDRKKLDAFIQSRKDDPAWQPEK